MQIFILHNNGNNTNKIILKFEQQIFRNITNQFDDHINNLLFKPTMYDKKKKMSVLKTSFINLPK